MNTAMNNETFNSDPRLALLNLIASWEDKIPHVMIILNEFTEIYDILPVPGEGIKLTVEENALVESIVFEITDETDALNLALIDGLVEYLKQQPEKQIALFQLLSK
jgi:hypothetical protein